MSSRNHKEVHGNKRPVANTAGMEQRSNYHNDLTKKKQIGDYPKEPNRRLGDVGGNTPSSMGTLSATSTKDPVIDTDSDDDVSTSVIDTRKLAPVDDTIRPTVLFTLSYTKSEPSLSNSISCFQLYDYTILIL